MEESKVIFFSKKSPTLLSLLLHSAHTRVTEDPFLHYSSSLLNTNLKAFVNNCTMGLTSFQTLNVDALCKAKIKNQS